MAVRVDAGNAALIQRVGQDAIRLEVFLNDTLSPELIEHCQRTAKCALELAAQHNEDQARAYVAALLHDTAKPLDPARKRTLLMEGATVLPQALRSDLEDFMAIGDLPEGVMHSWAGAILCVKELGLNDAEVLSAMAKHTTGSLNMSALDKIVFLADIIEPHRSLPHLDKLRSLAAENLSYAFYFAISSQLSHLIKRDLPVHSVIYKIIEQGITAGFIQPPSSGTEPIS